LTVPTSPLPRGLLTVKPTQLWWVFLLAGVGLHYGVGTFLGWTLPLPWPVPVAIAMFVLGFVLMIWTWMFFERTKTPIKPTDTPTTFLMAGPYRICRNPMYLGMLLMLLGAAYVTRGALALLAPAAFFVAMNGTFIPHEETVMEETFGEEYFRYRSRVRRWM
jgi:protein-S-isoprenylcysteine O-methyltransferase Ste14